MCSKTLITCQSSAPGKVILHGEHSVVYGKTAIAASLGLKTTCTITECLSNTNVIRINFPNIGLHNLLFEYEDLYENVINKTSVMNFTQKTPEQLQHEEFLSIIEKYLENFQKKNQLTLKKYEKQAIEIFLYVYCAMMGKIDYKFTSFDVKVDSNLTIGSGIGSSASFAVSLVGAIYQYALIKSSSEPITESDVQLSDSDKDIISNWAFCCEKISHGNPSGVDNTICTHGSLVEFKKGSAPVMHKLDMDFKICLVHTRVERNTKSYVEKVAKMRERYPEIVDSIMEACDKLTITALKVIQKLQKEKDISKQHEYFMNMAEFFEINHSLLRTLDVSHPMLEKICSISKDLGFSCKLTGAGGGGFAIILIPPFKKDEEVNQLVNLLKSHNFDTQITMLGGDGVTISTKHEVL